MRQEPHPPNSGLHLIIVTLNRCCTAAIFRAAASTASGGRHATTVRTALSYPFVNKRRLCHARTADTSCVGGQPRGRGHDQLAARWAGRRRGGGGGRAGRAADD